MREEDEAGAALASIFAAGDTHVDGEDDLVDGVDDRLQGLTNLSSSRLSWRQETDEGEEELRGEEMELAAADGRNGSRVPRGEGAH